MTRLLFIVEGRSERVFVERTLAPALPTLSCEVKSLDGRVNVDRIADVVRRTSHSFHWVTTLVDLYGFRQPARRSVAELEAAMLRESKVPNLIPYVQKYEFEALILANHEALIAELKHPGVGSRIAALLARNDPETINDTPERKPSARLDSWHVEAMRIRYQKQQHGPGYLLPEALPRIRARCPRFGAWLARLEALPSTGGV